LKFRSTVKRSVNNPLIRAVAFALFALLLLGPGTIVILDNASAGRLP